jgi:hypothetical protein
MKNLLITLALIGLGVYVYRGYNEAKRQKVNLKK